MAAAWPRRNAGRTALARPAPAPTPPPADAAAPYPLPPRRALHLEALAAVQAGMGFKMPFLTQEETWALTLTTFAGLSTTVGAAFAVSRRCRCAAGARCARQLGVGPWQSTRPRGGFLARVLCPHAALHPPTHPPR